MIRFFFAIVLFATTSLITNPASACGAPSGTQEVQQPSVVADYWTISVQPAAYGIPKCGDAYHKQGKIALLARHDIPRDILAYVADKLQGSDYTPSGVVWVKLKKNTSASREVALDWASRRGIEAVVWAN